MEKLDKNITEHENHLKQTAMNNEWLTIEREEERVILKKCSQEAEGEVIIPDGVTDIADSAFIQCHNVNEVHIPNGVKAIGKDAFLYCDLISIQIPSSVTKIDSIIYQDQFEQSPFYGNCHIASISVDKGNPVYDSRDNCNAIIETSTNRLILGCKNTYIPDSVPIIGSGAFFFFDTPLKIPNGVKVIEPYAFYYCFFPSIDIPNKDIVIHDVSFRHTTKVRIR